MSLDLKQQLNQALSKTKNPLLALRENPSIDGLAGAIALARKLKKEGKNPEIVSCEFRPPKLSFFPKDETINSVPQNKSPFILSLDVTKTKVGEMTYELADGKLNLYLTPKDGKWKQDDLSFKENANLHDLIITFECPDLKLLGKVFEDDPTMFSSSPIINIDHDSGNERYGHINIVDVTATSCSEIIYPLIHEGGLDEATATLLLAGIIYKTRSFKNENVSPRALRYASELVLAGAKRETIVHELYKNKDVPTLRLWGRALARLKHDVAKKLAWSVLTREDFVRAGAGEEALPSVVHELIAFSKDVEAAVLIYENVKNKICVRVISTQNKDALKLAERWQGKGSTNETEFCLEGSDLISAEKQVIENISKILSALPS